MVNRKLITGAFLALCSTAALAPSRTNFDRRLQANVSAWLNATNACGDLTHDGHGNRLDESGNQLLELSPEAKRQADEARAKKQEEADAKLVEVLKDKLVAEERSKNAEFNEADFRQGLADIDQLSLIPFVTIHNRTTTVREQIIEELGDKAANEARAAKTLELEHADASTLDRLREKQFAADRKQLAQEIVDNRARGFKDPRTQLYDTLEDFDRDAEERFDKKQDSYSDNSIKAAEAENAARSARQATHQEFDPQFAFDSTLAQFADFTLLAKIPLFDSPGHFMAHSAAWAVGVRATKGMSILDATTTAACSLAGTLAAALIITLSNSMKSAQISRQIPNTKILGANRHLDIIIPRKEIPYSIANYKSNFILALSLIPYLMGQNPDFVVRTFKTARRLGFKGSIEEMIKTIKAGFTKDGSTKDRAAFLARTFGPFASAFGVVFFSSDDEI